MKPVGIGKPLRTSQQFVSAFAKFPTLEMECVLFGHQPLVFPQGVAAPLALLAVLQHLAVARMTVADGRLVDQLLPP